MSDELTESEIQKLREQVEYYRNEVDTINKLYEKERLDHQETKKATYVMMQQFKAAMDADIATKMAIQSAITEKAGDLVKSANATARASSTVGGWMNSIEEDLKKSQQQKETPPSQQQQPKQQEQ